MNGRGGVVFFGCSFLLGFGNVGSAGCLGRAKNIFIIFLFRQLCAGQRRVRAVSVAPCGVSYDKARGIPHPRGGGDQVLVGYSRVLGGRGFLGAGGHNPSLPNQATYSVVIVLARGEEGGGGLLSTAFLRLPVRSTTGSNMGIRQFNPVSSLPLPPPTTGYSTPTWDLRQRKRLLRLQEQIWLVHLLQKAAQNCLIWQ